VGVRVGTDSPRSFCTTVCPDFFGTTCVGFTHWLSEIGYMIPVSNYLATSSFTTSLMQGFNLCISVDGLVLSLQQMRCMQIEGLISFKLAIDHPMAPLCYLSTSINWFSWSGVKQTTIMTGRVSFSSRKTYLSVLGRGFSSSCGGDWMDESISSLAKSSNNS